MSKKLLAIVLVLAMVLALPVVAMADNLRKPVATQTTTQPATIQSVTIGGVTADYYVDGYYNSATSQVEYDSSQVFIRASMPATNTEESLKTQTVIIVLSSGKTITGGSLINTYTHPSSDPTGTYTFTGVDLLNKAYTITITDGNNTDTYIIAAGLNDNGHLPTSIPSTDPLSVSDFDYGTGNDADVYRVTVQNPCMGNPYYDENNNTGESGWTFCNYFIKALNVTIANMSSADIAFTKNASATLSGDISNVNITGNTAVSAKANLNTSEPKLTVSYGGNTRSYKMIARVASADTIWVTYGISFEELHLQANSYYYASQVKLKADKIESDAKSYFDEDELVPWGDIEVEVGTTAMDVIQAFMSAMSYPEYDPDSTYISSINGLGAFDTTGMDGWMYTDSANGWSMNCHLPSYGAADWYLSAGDRITWFYTTDFTQYTNW